MTAESSSDNLSAPSSVVSVDTTINQQQQQRTAWAQVVRGENEASEEVSFSDCSKETQMENSDSNQSNVDHPKKPAWNKPLNGVVGVGPVMGGDVSWPALSESTKTPFKSAADSSKPISDSSVSTSQVPVISHSPKKHANTNPNPNFTPNHTMPVRQRFSKRGGGTGGGSVHSGFNRPPPPPPPPLPLPLPLPPPFPLYEMPYSALVAAVPDSSIGEPPYKGHSWEGRPIGGFGSQSHSVNDHSSHRNSSRRGNFNSHGSRRDQDRDWNASRSSNARDVHLSPHQIALPGGFIRSPSPPPPPPPPPPPAGYVPFIMPPSVRHFGNHMGFDMTSSFWYVPSGVPLISHAPPPPPPMFSPVANLPASLLNQINYYFSDDNLVRDDFLRSNMDDEGWVPITLIAGFPRIQQLTVNIKLILDSLRTSSVVEVKDYKVRRRYSWKKWIPKYGWFGTDSGSQSLVGSTYNTITTSLQKVTLDEAIANQSSITGKEDSSTGAVPRRGSSEDLTNHSKLANGECIIEEACSSQI